MATIRDVASRAGVSTMTVSRVLNNSGYVSQDARQRVEAAVAELGYVPNTLGLSLRFKRTKTLALVLTDITNPFFTTIARGVEDAASDRGFTVILCNTDESETEQARYLNSLLGKRVDGILLVPARSAPGPVLWLQKRGMPVVVLDRRVPEAVADVVRCDSEAGAYELTRLLLDLGHRRIAMLGGPLHVSTARDRVAGFTRAYLDAGIDTAPLILNAPYSMAGGADMMKQVLRAAPRSTAVFAGNNFIAIGAFRAAREAGICVPDDLAMVAFDDLPESIVLDPFLTVAAQPAYEMGRKATELLLARLAGEGSPEPQEILLPTEIVVRRSSGLPLRQAGNE
jgi:LacI family transcriptional regulator